MRRALIKIATTALGRLGVGVTSYANLQKLKANEENGSALDNIRHDVEFLLAQSDDHICRIVRNLRRSRSQRRQDLFVLSQLDFKTGGFFVEFGAADGFDISNTYLLEKDFGWTGILAEPAKRWHEALRANRTASIETACVWRDSNSTVAFREVENGDLSTIDAYSGCDYHSKERENGTTYRVTTISLEDLLAKYDAPAEIDYLSIDTEGSEFEILSTFPFSKYRIKIISCEHNFAPQRAQISALLTAAGYVRIWDDLSQFDDWYVRRNELHPSD